MNRLAFEFWMIMAETTDLLSEAFYKVGLKRVSRFWDRVFWRIFRRLT